MSTIVLCGKSGAGKNTVGLEMEKLGYKKIVTYTTRPMRKGEVNGVDYHFVSENEFQKLLDEARFAETASYAASFGFCRYGSLEEDYGQDKTYVILNPIGLKAVKESGADIFVAYLYADDTVLAKRLKERGDKHKEITRRLASDMRDFADIDKYVDITISTRSEPVDIAENIIDLAREKELILKNECPIKRTCDVDRCPYDNKRNTKVVVC